MRRGYFFGLAILTAAISIGCGRGSGTHPDVPAGQLLVSPSILDFGKVAVGHKATKTGTPERGERAYYGDIGRLERRGVLCQRDRIPGHRGRWAKRAVQSDLRPAQGRKFFREYQLLQRCHKLSAYGSTQRRRNPGRTAQRHSLLARWQIQYDRLQHIPRGQGQRAVYQDQPQPLPQGHLHRWLGPKRTNLLLRHDRLEQARKGKQALKSGPGDDSELLRVEDRP